ncbi:hypothetical protein EYZ11_011638 [Aspergillus tanneri]|uniref:CCHC-type domain-containing protein n=1 Tax=Aspergillus tanneri TaxID=1220188 RepID=A0A4S3J295_9EURO|nr:hypothetical protein EYZ11_011638 [Aspergillus tanneri]
MAKGKMNNSRPPEPRTLAVPLNQSGSGDDTPSQQPTKEETPERTHQTPAGNENSHLLESSASDNQNPDTAALREEIRKKEEEYVRLKLQRRDKELDELIAAERAKLERATQPQGQPENKVQVVWSRDETTEVTNPVGNAAIPPSRPAMTDLYEGRDMTEYRTFLARTRNHFIRNSYYFTNDAVKVADGASYLSSNLLLLWEEYHEELRTPPNWEEFTTFLLHQLNDPTHVLREAKLKYQNAKRKPEDSVREANLKYQTARQRPEDSVREFVRYISKWESQLPEPYTERQRKDHLRASILDEIRIESLKYPNEPDTYDGYVAHLQTIEDQIPSRGIQLTAARKNSRGSNQQNTRDNRSFAPQVNIRGAFASRSRGSFRGRGGNAWGNAGQNYKKREFSATFDKNQCANCGAYGHWTGNCLKPPQKRQHSEGQDMVKT